MRWRPAALPRQPLLIPEIVELDPADVDRVAARAEELAELGLVVEAFGPDAVMVRETPAMLGKVDVKALLRDLADDIAETRLGAVAEGAARRGRRHACLPYERARRSPAHGRRNECAAARDGSDAAFRAMQSRPSDLCGIETRRHRASVRPALETRTTDSVDACADAGRVARCVSCRAAVAPSGARLARCARARASSPARPTTTPAASRPTARSARNSATAWAGLCS